MAAIDAAPLLHKGEAAQRALGQLSAVLVALDGRLTAIEAALSPLVKL